MSPPSDPRKDPGKLLLSKRDENEPLPAEHLRVLVGQGDAGRFQHKVVPLEAIVVQEQVRLEFDEEAHALLTESVRAMGVLNPLWVNVREGSSSFELIAGERRYRAAVAAGLSAVPALAIKDATEVERLQLQLIENEQRVPLTELEQARAGVRLLAERLGVAEPEVAPLLYRLQNQRKRQVQVALVERVSDEQAALVDEVLAVFLQTTLAAFTRRRLSLLDLPTDVLEAYEAKRITSAVALTLRVVPDAAQRAEWIELVASGAMTHDQLRAEVRVLARKPASAQPEALRRLQGLKARLTPQRYAKLPSATQVQIKTLLGQLEALVADAEADAQA